MKEQLSALMDDQEDQAVFGRCLDRLKEDDALSESWKLYHLIGDVLRGTDGAALPESFRDRLAAEPTVVAPRARLSTGGSRGALRYALPIAASVAAVAFVAWVGLPQLQPAPALQARSGAPTANVAAVPVAPDVSDYLLAHQRFSPSSAMSGVAPYVRTVSESRTAR